MDKEFLPAPLVVAALVGQFSIAVPHPSIVPLLHPGHPRLLPSPFRVLVRSDLLLARFLTHPTAADASHARLIFHVDAEFSCALCVSTQKKPALCTSSIPYLCVSMVCLLRVGTTNRQWSSVGTVFCSTNKLIRTLLITTISSLLLLSVFLFRIRALHSLKCSVLYNN